MNAQSHTNTQSAIQNFSFSQLRTEDMVEWIFRIGLAWEFIGHGAWGIIGKAGWVPYFGIFGIPEWLAWKMMPVVGTVDVILGLFALFVPTRALLLYMTFWGIFTALLRPFAGQGWWEFFERFYNFGFAFSYLWMVGFPKSAQHWFSKLPSLNFESVNISKLIVYFRMMIGVYMIGHGGFGVFMDKAMLANQYTAIGLTQFFTSASMANLCIGWVEILLGVAVMIRPFKYLVGFVLIWTVGRELLYPIAGSLVDTFEFIERGGSYGAPLVLLILSQVGERRLAPRQRR